MGLIWGLILGAIAGCIASAIMSEKSGLFLIGFRATGMIGSLVVSTVGACICIWLGRKLF